MENDGEDGDTGVSTTTLYLAVFIPVAVLIVIIVICAFWYYIKRTAPKHPIRFKSLKDVPRTQHYKIFSNPQILEDYIRQNTSTHARSTHVSDQGAARPTFITVPNGGDTSYHSSHGVTATGTNAQVQPYIIPVRLSENVNGMSNPHQGHDESVTVFRMPSKENTSTPSRTRTANDAFHVTSAEDPLQHQYTGSSNEHLDRSNIEHCPDGSVIIHVDNLSRTSKPGSSLYSQPRTRSLTPTSLKDGSWTGSDSNIDF